MALTLSTGQHVGISGQTTIGSVADALIDIKLVGISGQTTIGYSPLCSRRADMGWDFRTRQL